MKTVNSRLWKPFQAPAFNQHLKLGEIVVLFYIITSPWTAWYIPKISPNFSLTVLASPVDRCEKRGIVKGGWKIWRPWCHQLLCFLDPWENGVFFAGKIIFDSFGCRINSLRLLLKLGDSPPSDDPLLKWYPPQWSTCQGWIKIQGWHMISCVW